MKKSKIIVEFEKEKLEVLQFYFTKKEESLEDELVQTVEKLYEKYVPSSTREYIESRLKKEVSPPKTTKEPQPRETVKEAQKSESGEANKTTSF